MSFGKMPIANGFLVRSQFAYEYFYELATAHCPKCSTFQIVQQPDPSKMFHAEYAFFTRTSRYMVAHFAEFSKWARERLLQSDDPFVVEIGCNDGAMLENFARLGFRHLGVEPSANVAAEAARHGILTKVAFFGRETAREIREQSGPANLVLAANVICHIPDINDVAAGISLLLADDGVFAFEEPYLGAMIEKGSYDQIYDEHAFIFSVDSVRNAFAPHGLEVIDAVPQTTHGGSMRYVLSKRGARPVAATVERVIASERVLGLHKPETYDAFRARCERSRDDLVDVIRKLRAAGRRVVGYAATSKSTTVLNYCGLGPQDIEFISDTTPVKQNKFTPGSHIPILGHEKFVERYPDYAVLFAWNHEAEILEKENPFVSAGGKWIKFVPNVAVI